MIPVAVPNITDLEKGYVAEALNSGYVGPDGPFVRKFEQRICSLTGMRWAVATCSGTAALELAVACCWPTPRPHMRPVVSVPTYGFPAMANVLLRMGFAPTLVLGGIEHDVYEYRCAQATAIIADCAPALGQPIPHSATVAAFSFAANKVFTCGMGGALVGNNPRLERMARTQAKQGLACLGRRNIRMSNLNAALGYAQLARYETLHAAKVDIWNCYSEAGIPLISRGGSRWMATAQLPDLDETQRADVQERFRNLGIETRAELFPGLGLPCSTGITNDQLAKVIDAWHSIF